MRRQVCELIEVRYARLQFFEPPIVREALSGREADGPIVIFTGYRIAERLPLTMALDAGIIAAHIVQCLRVNNVGFCRVRCMQTSWPVAFFAADVPLCDLLGFYVVVHRMASVAKWA